MEKGLVSVVVPVYNVEQCLDRCIESIAGQTYTKLEIILVDDGSPDKCPQICDVWAERDSRIKVIHKTNSGLGMARNTGIDHATGQYICFVDSDDYIAPDTVECAYHVACETDADMVCYGMNVINPKGVKIGCEIPVATPSEYCGEEVQRVFLPRLIGSDPETGEHFAFSMSACTRLYSLRCIKRRGWRFVSEREVSSEDYYSVVDLCADVEKVCILPRPYYNYCLQNVSVSRSYRKDRFEQACHFYAEIKKMCEAHGYTQEVIHRLGGAYLSLVVAAMKQEVASANPLSDKRKALQKMLQHEVLQRTLKQRKKDNVRIKKKLLFWAMRHRLTDVCYVLLLAQNAVT